MTLLRHLYYCRAWLRNLVSVRALSAVLSSFGALWLAVQMARFFLERTKWPDAIRNSWLLFGLVGLVVAVWMCKPHLVVSHKLNGRDVAIEIAVGDLFSFSGALVIGSNTTFDTRISRDLISDKSVQGRFTKQFYGDETQLDAELSARLVDFPSHDLREPRVGKKKRFPMGTCVRLNPKQRTAYFVAITDINEHGVASGTFDDLQESLAKLWIFIGQRGLKESLVIPVLGTGFSRLSQTREEVVREIIRSFTAACSEKTFADKLTIVITPHDVAKHSISLQELGSFLRHVCHYADFSVDNRQEIGTPV
jgi:hypothetical protein